MVGYPCEDKSHWWVFAHQRDVTDRSKCILVTGTHLFHSGEIVEIMVHQ